MKQRTYIITVGKKTYYTGSCPAPSLMPVGSKVEIFEMTLEDLVLRSKGQDDSEIAGYFFQT